MQSFSTAAVLSVTTEVFLCKWDELIDLLEYMTGDTPYTTAIPQFLEIVAPVILAQHPELASITEEYFTAAIGNPPMVAPLVAQASADLGRETWDLQPMEKSHPVDQLSDVLDIIASTGEGGIIVFRCD